MREEVQYIFEKSIFVQKFNFDQKPKHFHPIFLVKSKSTTAEKLKTTTFSRVFHPRFFWQFFSWNESCHQLKSPKPQHVHEFFTPKKSTIISGNQSSKLNLWTKNEDFEQCKRSTYRIENLYIGRSALIWVQLDKRTNRNAILSAH